MRIIKKTDSKVRKGYKVNWKPVFKGGDEFYETEKVSYVVGGKNNSILTDTSIIKGKPHSFKLFGTSPFDGKVVLKFLDNTFTENEREWKYGDKVDINKGIGDEIEYSLTKMGYAHTDKIENYIISSKYKDGFIIKEKFEFTDTDLVLKDIYVISFQNYDGGVKDSYVFKIGDKDVTGDIKNDGNAIILSCKLKDTITFSATRNGKNLETPIVITITDDVYNKGKTEKTFDFKSLNGDFKIKCNNENINGVKNIGYGYNGNNNVLLQFENPNSKDGVKITSDNKDVDLESGYYTGSDDKWIISFTVNTTGKDKNYNLTFTSDYYKTYVWSFVQKCAVEGSLSWKPYNLTYDTSTPTGIKIPDTEGNLTPYYEILEARCGLTDMTSDLQSVLDNDTGFWNLQKVNFPIKGKFKITMRITGESNSECIKPDNFQPIVDSFYLTVI